MLQNLSFLIHVSNSYSLAPIVRGIMRMGVNNFGKKATIGEVVNKWGPVFSMVTQTF